MPPDTTTFLLEAPLPPPAWGRPLHGLRRLRDPRAQRFAFFGVGAVLVTGGATALFYEPHAAGWWLTLAAGLVLVARALHLWTRRPFLRIDDDGLTFRLTSAVEKHAVRWSELTRLDTELKGARLHRAGDAPTMHLAFNALPGDTAHRLTAHLADTARARGVPVHPG